MCMCAWRARRGRNGAGGEQRGGRLGLALSDERAGEDEKRADDALERCRPARTWSQIATLTRRGEGDTKMPSRRAFVPALEAEGADGVEHE